VVSLTTAQVQSRYSCRSAPALVSFRSAPPAEPFPIACTSCSRSRSPSKNPSTITVTTRSAKSLRHIPSVSQRALSAFATHDNALHRAYSKVGGSPLGMTQLIPGSRTATPSLSSFRLGVVLRAVERALRCSTHCASSVTVGPHQ
jgi:hypothetical protein